MDNRKTNPKEPKAEGVCEPSSLLDCGTLRRSSPWPFKFTLQDNRWYVNRARRARKTSEDHYQEALM